MLSFDVICYLSDQEGNALNPAEEGSICYKDLSWPDCYGQQQAFLQAAELSPFATASVFIEGYTTVLACRGELARTVPFRMVQCVPLVFQPEGELRFRTVQFSCCAKLASVSADSCAAEIFVRMESAVTLPTQDEQYSSCCHGGYGCSESFFKSCTYNSCRLMPLRAEVYQYNALGDGETRIFTNEDEMKQYGCRGILDPRSVSFCHLFVDGVLQPDSTYQLKTGCLKFTTWDVPAEGVPIAIQFATIKGEGKRYLNGKVKCYVAVSDGVRSIYTDEDEWTAYTHSGIPDPEKVSCWSLFVNGVLQPQAAYQMEKGVLKLCEAPLDGQIIMLEAILMQDAYDHLLKASAVQYVALSKGRRLFTNCDREEIYHPARITLPFFSSYQSVFVNGVLQPEATYQVGSGYLRFFTGSAPSVGAPVTQQAVSVF